MRIIPCCVRRCENESDTAATDSDNTWGGLGEFEYSLKGMPHALQHTPELVIRGGHHDAFCTSVNEEGHKHFNKMAAKFARKYASFNQTQDGMLDWVNRDKIWEEAGRLANCPSPDVSPSPSTTESDAAADMVKRLRVPLTYTNNWSSAVHYTIRAGRPSRWGRHYFHPKSVSPDMNC